MEYGTNLVAGVTPGRGGSLFMDSVPVFNTVEQAVRETEANATLIFVPAAFAADAMVEAIDAGLPLVICITEGVPVLDTAKVTHYKQGKASRLIGPNCPGLISPGAKCKMGIMPGQIHSTGKVGVVSRSGTLTYETVNQLTSRGIGQSTCVGIGGDPIIGSPFTEILQLFEDDPDTEAVVLIGEIGGSAEQEAAEFIRDHMTKPVAALIVGQTAPPGRRMGHAGAIITGNAGRAEDKMKALGDAGAFVIPNPTEIGATTERMLASIKA
ncbi:MAG: succinyl-CoA synthetase alpha subunit [Chloroflexi bacterium]|jgi:succinyl-CoA synthetase alpha subunit|nr:MAG: succinyl-CoA synthetase alpha subunit [Chloroflexota bacterium]